MPRSSLALVVDSRRSGVALSLDRVKVSAIFDWLVDGCPGHHDPMTVIARLGERLRAAGLPVDRMSTMVRTLHPHIAGRRFLWTPGEALAAVSELEWESLETVDHKRSPLGRMFESGLEVRHRLDFPTRHAELEQLRDEGYTDYCALPLKFMGGSTHAATFCTKTPGGFTEEQLAALRQVWRPMARVAETFALMRTTVNLLNAYVGRDAGERILRGKVHRGDTENIRCVIWFSDLRGFTSLSGERAPAETIKVLNALFDCQVPAIDAHGGEVLKFMGDGMLAIFPIDETRDIATAGAAALAAVAKAFGALEQLNASRGAAGEPALRFGVGLHVGEVAYGNIGGASRLDFTCIGPAVNLASRIEGLTGKLDKRTLISAELAGQLRSAVQPAGTFELKGIGAAQAVFEPA